MHASEFQSESQRLRLKSHPFGSDFTSRDDGPFADIYIVAFKSPTTGRFRERSFNATQLIAERLIGHEDFSRHVRRIAYLDAVAEDDTLLFKKRFAFGSE